MSHYVVDFGIGPLGSIHHHSQGPFLSITPSGKFD
ncbi:unnamed protein product [Rhodiola kirilowii]